MKMRLRLSLIVMLVWVVGVGATESDASLFASIFAPQECQRACWYGIEPGVTTEAQLQQKLSELGLSYQTKIYHGSKYYHLGAEIYTKPFIEEGYGSPRIDIWNGLVGYIVLPVNIPLTSIRSTWKLPSKIEGGASVRMIYYDKGLYLEAENNDDAVTYLTMARDNILGETYVIPVEQGGPPPMSSCEDVSQAICDFVSPTFRPRIASYITSENCEHVCFLGIEPGTTKEQVKQILADARLPYEVYSSSDRADIYNIVVDETYIDVPFSHVMINFLEASPDEVQSVSLQIEDTPVQEMKTLFGSPMDLLIDPDHNIYYFIYPSQGFFFSTGEASGSSVNIATFLHIGRPEDIRDMFW